MQDDAWTKHYDDKYRAWYYFNSKTEESVWEGEEKASIIESSLVNKVKKSGKRNDQKGFSKFMQALQTSSRHSELDSFLRQDDEETVLKRDETNFSRFSLCNAVIFEAPLCCAEGLFRVTVLLILLLLWSCRPSASPANQPSKWKIILKDISLTLLATFLLAIPGFILLIYRQSSTQDEWKLLGIPTGFGCIDPRRFAIITMVGLGRSAHNASNVTSGRRGSGRTNDFSLDSWEDAIVYFPREVIQDCANLLNDESSVSSLQSILS
jgi:hypothetical protein